MIWDNASAKIIINQLLEDMDPKVVHFLIYIIQDMSLTVNSEYEDLQKKIEECQKKVDEAILDQANELINFFRIKRTLLEDNEFREYLELKEFEIEKKYNTLRDTVTNVNEKLGDFDKFIKY